jgi:hypothetical protein
MVYVALVRSVKIVVTILVGKTERKLFERNMYMWCWVTQITQKH